MNHRKDQEKIQLKPTTAKANLGRLWLNAQRSTKEKRVKEQRRGSRPERCALRCVRRRSEIADRQKATR